MRSTLHITISTINIIIKCRPSPSRSGVGWFSSFSTSGHSCTFESDLIDQSNWELFLLTSGRPVLLFWKFTPRLTFCVVDRWLVRMETWRPTPCVKGNSVQGKGRWMSLYVADNDTCRHVFTSVEVSLDGDAYSCICRWCDSDSNRSGCDVVVVTMIPPPHTHTQLKQTREKELRTFPRIQHAQHQVPGERYFMRACLQITHISRWTKNMRNTLLTWRASIQSQHILSSTLI